MRALALAALLLPAAARACSVCFDPSASQKGLVDGIWWGIMLLLAATFAMVGGIGWLLWKVESKRQEAEA